MQKSILFTGFWHKMCFFDGNLTWYHTHILTHMHTQRNTAPSEVSRLTHSCKYIFTPPVMCSKQLSLLQWMNNSLISKVYFPRYPFFFKDYSLVKVIYLLIRCYKARFFLCNKNNTDRNGVKRNTNTVTHTSKSKSFKSKISQ